jgi:hypothetical protein
MGAWGPGLFSDDTTCEVRDEYLGNLKRGMSDRAAENQILERFADLFSVVEVRCLVYFALAATQYRHGRLSPRVKKATLNLLDAGGDLAGWEEDSPSNVPARRRALNALKKQITGPQKDRATVKVVALKTKKTKKKRIDLPNGTVFGMPLPDGSWAALLLVRHIESREQVMEPSFRLIDWSGSAAPTRKQLQKVPVRFLKLDSHGERIDELKFMEEGREDPIAGLVATDVVLPVRAGKLRSFMSADYEGLAEDVQKALRGKGW